MYDVWWGWWWWWWCMLMDDVWSMMHDVWWMMMHDDGWWMMGDGWRMALMILMMYDDGWWMMYDDGWWMMYDGWCMMDDDVWWWMMHDVYCIMDDVWWMMHDVWGRRGAAAGAGGGRRPYLTWNRDFVFRLLISIFDLGVILGPYFESFLGLDRSDSMFLLELVSRSLFASIFKWNSWKL